MSSAPLAIYVHMPWCVRKCPYCDFNSHQLKSAQPDRSYINALIRDFDGDAALVSGRRVDTVFFGGGTPSLFPPEEFHRLIGALRTRIEVAADAEITMEANPGTIERGRFSGYRDAGVNRVSLGAQTFAPRALRALGRIHSAEDTQRAVEELRHAGIANFNLDLMYALPEQTLEEALADVRMACALQPTHISYYQLTMEPGTVFHSRPPVVPDEDTAWQIQTSGQAVLAGAGYEQYEISAFATDGARCRHNLNYWLFGDYVGIGAGAHGKITVGPPHNVVRTVKPKQPKEYQDRVWESRPGPHGGIGRTTGVPATELAFEFMLNALRLNEGFSMEEFEHRTGVAAQEIEGKLAKAQSQRLLEARAGGWRPTALGRRFLNDLQASFLA